jgi:ATP-dependent Clp protease ATP-binding subunit ClpB
MMRFDKFTLKVQEALQEAQTSASKYRHPTLDVEHLLLTFLAQPEGIVGAILKKLGAETGQIAAELEKTLGRLPQVEGAQPSLAPRLNKVLESAIAEAARLTDEYVSAEHVLIAITEEKDGAAATILRNAGVTKDKIFQILVEIRGNQRITDPNPEEKYQALKRYARDFNELALRPRDWPG